MSSSEDVKTLFRRFGGEPETYQEVVQERQTLQSLNKWTMLGQIELGDLQAIPSARREVKGNAIRPLSKEIHPEIIQKSAVAALHAHSPSTTPTTVIEVASSDASVQQPALKPAHAISTQPSASTYPIQSQFSPFQRRVETVQVPTQYVSPLAARLQTPLTRPETNMAETQDNHQSLLRLFGRLSKPQSPSPEVGVLRRKFTK